MAPFLGGIPAQLWISLLFVKYISRAAVIITLLFVNLVKLKRFFAGFFVCGLI